MRPRSDGDNVTQAGFVVSELTAELEPHSERRFVRESAAAAEQTESNCAKVSV